MSARDAVDARMLSKRGDAFDEPSIPEPEPLAEPEEEPADEAEDE